MSKIEVLSQEVIDRVRATEVIQRPVDVVKELLDNALDAGATDIKIKIEGGGKKSIEISDDGCGMSTEDARKSLLPHATSKIKTLEDLDGITTLGFRGEALSSISTISLFELRTKEADSDIGTMVSNFGGQVTTKMIGCVTGTYLAVKALFYNAPARKASLKADAAETSAVTRLVGRYILLHPEICFSYSVNGKVHIIQRKGMSEESVLASVLGADTAKRMAKVQYEIDGATVSGFVGDPRLTKRTSEAIVISVNGRYVELIDPYIKIIRDAYRHSIQGHEFPCVILRITLDPKKVDPNVHPQKLAVDILDRELFKRLIFESVFSCQGNLSSCATSGFINPDQPVPKDAPLILSPNEPDYTFSDPVGGIDKFPKKEGPAIKEESKEASYSLPELEVIGQYKKSYILAGTKGFLFVIDQHAIHEKQLFEELYKKSEISVVKPPYPFIVNLTPEDSDLLELFSDRFKDHGLELEKLDHSTWKCYSVPALNGQAISETEILSLIKDTLGNLDPEPSLDDFRRKVLAEIACKSAIKANQGLGHAEMQRLLECGRYMHNAYYCPHGRPAVKVYREETVDKWFKR